jgi:hypothetical protein
MNLAAIKQLNQVSCLFEMKVFRTFRKEYRPSQHTHCNVDEITHLKRLVPESPFGVLLAYITISSLIISRSIPADVDESLKANSKGSRMRT